MYVERDPFARQELHRTFIPGASCAECGNQRTLYAKKGAWKYRVESDGGRVNEIRKEFCGTDCMRSYHG